MGLKLGHLCLADVLTPRPSAGTLPSTKLNLFSSKFLWPSMFWNNVSSTRLLSHPSLGWLYVFSSFPPRPPPPPRPPTQQLLPLTSKPFELNLTYLAQSIYGSGEMHSMTFPWPWPKVMAVASIIKNLLVCAIKWEPLIGSLQNLGCFKVKFRYSSISGIVALIDVKWKRSELIWYWADCMTFPFDHTHDLDPGVEISRSKSEIALSQEWDGQLTWNEKDVSHPFMTMILTSVTMMGWADVPDSNWGDFRCRRAIDISSFMKCLLESGMFFLICRGFIGKCHLSQIHFLNQYWFIINWTPQRTI